MRKLDFDAVEAIKAAVRAAMPAGWRYKLRSVPGNVPSIVCEITEAPVDLVALNGDAGKAYTNLLASTIPAIGPVRDALHVSNPGDFDARGDRAGNWYKVELRAGHWKRPFRALS